MWTFAGVAALIGFYLAGGYCALRATQTARTAQGAVGWVVFLLTVPVVAVPAYLLLGQHRYHGYYIARRESARVMKNIQDFGDKTAPAPGSTAIPPAPFEYCANLPAARGNAARLLIDGQQTFAAIFAAIDKAARYVLVQFYLIQDDSIGRKLRDHLVAAARRGVTIRIMTDPVASIGLPQAYLDALRAEGIIVADHPGKTGRWSRFKLNFRNHRKTVVVDGTCGFIGGLNVGDQYVGKNSQFSAWRDTHLELRGPMVSQLQLIFAEDWHWQTNSLLIDELTWEAPAQDEDAVGLIVATGPGDLTETGSLMFFSAICAAQERIWIASPYFVPDQDIVTALRHAALRGIDVRILMPDKADHHLVGLAALAYLDDIREAGVRIFRYTEGFMHQKVFVVDNALAAVGTTNLDNRSFRLNFEAMALFFDKEFALKVDMMLRRDMERSYEMERTLAEQPPFVRFGAPVARLFAPLL
ncbi:cardiolipin synthase [Sedimentitalea sp. JM2-8]|uniref:Cardiolipin synthase n=1 Tax=Sedimentitalea xiamensis TaxID=3050037 RepID=A0ABT7FC09_9RHOB|nr:cardiolipin synthase [Sedimentitalea xiamensis]MDK3072600.1 cardiolipin synthase [Sedimentitalea xiamensis]